MTDATDTPLYQLKITLRDVQPLIWRCIQVRDCTLAESPRAPPQCHGLDGGFPRRLPHRRRDLSRRPRVALGSSDLAESSTT